MPKNKIQKKDTNDKFYTKPEVARLCLDTLEKYLSSDDILIEPSCGSGEFFKIIKHKKIGIDILPECEDAIQMSWFDYTPPDNCVVVGNPPFGNRNDLSKEFIRHSIKYAKIVAFVLPSVFKKESLQSVFPDIWSLVEMVDLPTNSFTLYGEDYHVPCVFQIWIKNWDGVNIRESLTPTYYTTDFYFCDKNSATYFIFGAAPSKIISAKSVLTNNRGYYIHCDEAVKQNLLSIPWKKHGLSSVNGGVSWFSKKQILNIYGEYYGQKQPK